MSRILAFLAGFVIASTDGARAPAPADLAALNSVPREFSAARARGGGDALGMLMAPEIDFVTAGRLMAA